MAKRSLFAYYFCVLFLFGAAFLYYPKWQQPQTEATISWDVSGYYLYLPAVFLYKDLKQLRFADSLIAQYHFAPEPGAMVHPSGNRVIKYSSGQALQFLPWFLAGHAAALIVGYPADGFSLPYQFAISMGSLLLACLGLWFLRRILLQFFSDDTTALTLLLVVLGTNYLEYTAFHGALTHNWLFTVYALLLYSTLRFYERPSWFFAAAIGILVGWAALTRPTDLVSAIIPIAWGLHSRETLRERLRLWRQHWPKLMLAAALTASVGFIQLAYWKYVSGEWLVYSYQDQGFSWLHPHFADGLFSYKAGWLVYTPVMAFALAGLAPLARQKASYFPLVVVFGAVYLYITFAWDIWWYGGSLGQRALIQSYPVWALPLAAFVQAVLRRGTALKGMMALLAAVLVAYNLWLTHHAHKGGLYKAGEMTKAYFWRVLGRNTADESSLKLLDTRYDFRGERKQIQTLYTNNFDTDTLACPLPPVNGANSLFLNAERQFSPSYDIPLPQDGVPWIRATATFHCPQKEWEVWKMAQMILRFSYKGEPVKEYAIRVHRLLYDGQTRSLWLDAKTPRKPFDRMEVFFWNASGNKTLLIDDLQVEAFRE